MRTRWFIPSLALFVIPLCTLSAAAATLCASAGGSPGCFPTITAAIVAAAANDVIHVGPGTYTEAVVITKPLSLTGEGATIDASGLAQGIFVDGRGVANLASIHISGFTVKNANLEGILVLNASDVTVGSNVVLDNNRALISGSCSALPAFEPGEAQDCGEGIHLQGADHSIVTGNTVVGNSGGILLSDDTGATHDNLVSFNIVRDNPFACGITMASHMAAPTTTLTQPAGVFHNTVYGNRSMHNGFSVGGGAGIGIFASVPFAKTYGNVVVDNYVSENGHPGIAMHAHAPFQSLNDNMLVGNTVVNNGADTADAHTPGPTGINLYSLTPVTGNIISGNSIQNEAYGVGVSNPALVQVQFNAFHSQFGVGNLGLGPVDASENWWSCPNGPGTSSGCAEPVGSNIISAPWLTQSIPPQPSF